MAETTRVADNGSAVQTEGEVRILNGGRGFYTEERDELAKIYGKLAPGDHAEVEFTPAGAKYRLYNSSGEGFITAYPVFNGVSVLYDDMHLESFGEGSTGSFELVIEHCRQGRFEAATADGRRLYMGAGDVCVHNIDYGEINRSSMPYRHYHGCTIMIKDARDPTFAAFLKGAGINFEEISARTRAAGGFRLIGASERTERAFGGLYGAPEENRQGFLRLRVSDILLFLGGELKESAPAVKALHPDTAELIKQIERHIWRNLGGDLTVPALCAQFGMSATALKTHFKTMFGCPLHAYVNICRMQVAAVQLTESDMKIGEIARRAGFKNQSKFSQAFFRFSGCTPATWRRERRTADWAVNMPDLT